MTLYQLAPDETAFCESVVCAGFHDVKYATWQIMEAIVAQNVPGDFAEAGVLYGAHPAIMLKVLQKHGIRDRKVHLFDSFEGIPQATAEDGPEERSVYGVRTGDEPIQTTGVSASTQENVAGNLQKWGVFDNDMVVFHSGWFEEKMESESKDIEKLALLRVDCDLASPTRCVFRHLYPRVVSGGYVIEDDWGAKACRDAAASVAGPLPHATPVEGQPTTQWWRKGVTLTMTFTPPGRIITVPKL